MLFKKAISITLLLALVSRLEGAGNLPPKRSVNFKEDHIKVANLDGEKVAAALKDLAQKHPELTVSEKTELSGPVNGYFDANDMMVDDWVVIPEDEWHIRENDPISRHPSNSGAESSESSQSRVHGLVYEDDDEEGSGHAPSYDDPEEHEGEGAQNSLNASVEMEPLFLADGSVNPKYIPGTIEHEHKHKKEHKHKSKKESKHRKHKKSKSGIEKKKHHRHSKSSTKNITLQEKAAADLSVEELCNMFGTRR